MANLSVDIAGVRLKNPVITASGCYGFGRDYLDFYPLSALGGIALKGTTLKGRAGNPPPRIAETPCGMLNSVGLENPGAEYLVNAALPALAGCGTAIIANIAGATPEEYAAIAAMLYGTVVDIIEVNISCPNVKAGGMAFGTTAEGVKSVVKAARAATKKPLMIKLSPNVTSIADMARAAESEGADALSLINTLLGMRIDINTRRPILRNNVGGLSGPAIFPVALRMVWQVSRAVKLPIVGGGGISRWQDAIEMMMAGARAIEMGTALFADPMAPIKVIEGVGEWLDRQGVKDINEIVGSVSPWGD